MTVPPPTTTTPTTTATTAIPGKIWLFRVFFFAVFVYLLYQLLLIFQPFLTALMGAATLVLMFHPAYRAIERQLGDRRTLAATIGTVGLLLVIVIPVLLLAWLVSREAADMLPAVREWVVRFQAGESGSFEAALPAQLQEVLARIEAYFASWGIDVRGMGIHALEAGGEKLSSLGAAVLSNALGILLDVGVLVIGVFFFLRDGGRMVRGVVDYIPMERVHKELLVRRLDETFAAVVRGVFITASVQGILAGIGFAIAQMPYALLLAFATAFLALIPFVGAAGVWVPACIYLFLVGRTGAAIFLLVWGVVVISLIDNFLKPVLIQGKAQISTFLLFFGILGGLQVYGFLGIFIGPLMIGLLLTFAKIYREQFQPVSILAPGGATVVVAAAPPPPAT